MLFMKSPVGIPQKHDQTDFPFPLRVSRPRTSSRLHETDLSILDRAACLRLAGTKDPGTNATFPVRHDIELCAAKKQQVPGFEIWRVVPREKGKKEEERKGEWRVELEEVGFVKEEGAPALNQSYYYGGQKNLFDPEGKKKLSDGLIQTRQRCL